MAVRYLDDGNDDGTCLGQSSTEKISFFGSTPVTQPTGGASLAIVLTNSSALSACVSGVQEIQTGYSATRSALRTLGLMA